MKKSLRICIVASATVAALCAGGLAQAQQGSMTFFVTSAGSGKGADLGGLDGADKICQSLAQAAGAGGKTWRAYLSTQGAGGVNARDRIGKGPWTNAKGVVIAKDVAELHGTNNLTKQTALTEKGAVVNGRGDTPNMHDILTGSQPDGTKFPDTPDMTCGNWTKSSGGRRDGRAFRPHGARRERTGEILELVAPVAGSRRRLQPERPQEHGRQRLPVLLRGELAPLAIPALRRTSATDVRVAQKMPGRQAPARYRNDFLREAYWPCAARAFSSCALTASRLKLAPGCIGGNSIAVCATFATSCCTNTKRQNS